MADGSGTPASLKARADAAAAEAAREARAEVLEQEPPAKDDAKPSTTRGKPAKTAKSSKEGDPWHRFVVDVWITNFNSVEFGLYKKSRNKAKSRQFTSDMDIFAEVVENGQRTGLLGYREELWRKNTGMDRRLVFKLFGEKLNWHATMDLMLGRSLQLTLGAHGLPVTCFSVNCGDHEQMIYLERSAHKWPLMPESFSFFVIENGVPNFYRLKRALFSVGGDYTLYDQTGHAVGYLDGKVLTLGGKWKGSILKEFADKRLLMVLKLFCGMLLFNGQSRRHVRRLARDVHSGRLQPKIERQEADLYMNPRRVR
jgi:hypothetical protein